MGTELLKMFLLGLGWWPRRGDCSYKVSSVSSFRLLELSHGCLYGAKVFDGFDDLVAALNKGERIPPKHLFTGDLWKDNKDNAWVMCPWLPLSRIQKKQSWSVNLSNYYYVVTVYSLCIDYVFSARTIHSWHHPAYLEGMRWACCISWSLLPHL